MTGELLSTPAVLVAIGILLFVALVLTAVGYLMARAGLSIRPVFWFAGFFLIVALPQLVYHVYTAVRAQSAAATLHNASESVGGTLPDAPFESLFGPDVTSAITTDLRIAGSLFETADTARFAVFPGGETVLLARFADGPAAANAALDWLRISGLQDMAAGDTGRGFLATRPSGDRAFVLSSGRLLGVWTASDDATIRARMAAGGITIPANAPLGNERAGPARTANGQPARPDPLASVPLALQFAALGLLVLVTIAYFFKGAAWAASTARADVPPVTAAELRSRILAINNFDLPFFVSAPENSTEISVTWRYGEQKWADILRLHGTRLMHRVVLRLDDRAHIARVSDYTAGYDAAFGHAGSRPLWRATMGITFFHYQEERVLGLRFADDGAPAPDPAYQYRFNLQELKAPLIAAVTHAGWDWKPVVWATAPVWLRWLTE